MCRKTPTSPARQLEDSGARHRRPASECCRYRAGEDFRPPDTIPSFYWLKGDRGGAPNLRDTGEERQGNDIVEWARWQSAPGESSTAGTPNGRLGRPSFAPYASSFAVVIARDFSGTGWPGRSRRFRRATHADHAGWLAEGDAQGCGQANSSGRWFGGGTKGKGPRSEALRGLRDP